MSRQFVVREIGEGDEAGFIMIPNTLALGKYFDMLMKEKGWVVDRMVSVQKEEQAEAESLMKEEAPVESAPSEEMTENRSV